MNGLETLFTQNVAAIPIVASFIWYLSKKDRLDKEIHNQFTQNLQDFNKTLQNHLHENNLAISNSAKCMQELTDLIKSNRKRKK